jgi:hypothetical protein
MTSWLGLLSVFADAVILLVLAAAIANRNVSRLARLVIATVAFVCAWLIAAGSDAMGVRGWTIFLSAAVIVVSLAAITATLHFWTLGGEGGDAEPGPRGAHGGGGPRRSQPDAPQHGGGGAPSWWPDFERQFEAYVAESERSRATRRVSDSTPTRAAAVIVPAGGPLTRTRGGGHPQVAAYTVP